MRIESLPGLLSQFPDIDGIWDFEDLPKTELTIREQLSSEEKAWSPKLVELLTQLARVQGLMSKQSEAGATLLLANGLLSKHQEKGVDRANVRFLLEQGRFFGLAMNPSQSLIHFKKASDLAIELGEVFFEIEADLMMSISQPPKFKNELLKKALQRAESTNIEEAKLWLPILYVMDGWHSFDFRRFEEALESFQKALSRPQPPQDSQRTFGIRWSIGRALRALNRFQEALDVQSLLHAELGVAGKINGHVFLEMAECSQSLKKFEEAKNYFELAYKELSLNGWYADNKASELSRIQHLSKKK